MFRFDELADKTLTDIIMNQPEYYEYEYDFDYISFRIPIDLGKYVNYFVRKCKDDFLRAYGINLTYSEVTRCALVHGYTIAKELLDEVYNVYWVIEEVLRPSEDYIVLSEIDDFYIRVSRYGDIIKIPMSKKKKKVSVRNVYNVKSKVGELSDVCNISYSIACNICLILSFGTELKFKTYYQTVSSLHKFVNDYLYEFEDFVVNNIEYIGKYIRGVKVGGKVGEIIQSTL